jgi:zeta-carotene desaturase
MPTLLHHRPPPHLTTFPTRPPLASHSQALSAVVVGGGLAGIATAIRLAERGVAVTLVETRQRLGGRATSFTDPTTDRTLDNCQHVLMGCCTHLIDLYTRLGVADRIHWHRRLYFADAAGTVDTLEADDLPAPLHLARGLLSFRTFTLPEKLAIARAMLAILRLGATGRHRWHDRTFLHWLQEHRQPQTVIDRFWSVIVTSALNETPARASASYALQVFQEGFLAHERAYEMGLAAVPLVELYDPAHRAITRTAGTVMLSTSAERFSFDGRHITALQLADGRTLHADLFVSTVPFDRLAKLCPPSLTQADPRLHHLHRFQVSPIIGIHLWFASPRSSPTDLPRAFPFPHLILTQSPLHWIFNKGTDPDVTGPDHTPTQHLHGVISAACDLVDRPAEDLIRLAEAELRKAVPAARQATLVHARVIKEKRATFSIAPGTDALRPAARGPVSNLYLAGDWCATGWPATMEGAVRSGYSAAAAALQDHDLGEPAPVPDLAPATLTRWLAR